MKIVCAMKINNGFKGDLLSVVLLSVEFLHKKIVCDNLKDFFTDMYGSFFWRIFKEFFEFLRYFLVFYIFNKKANIFYDVDLFMPIYKKEIIKKISCLAIALSIRR